jgi:transcription-repair coupling factor (superfamily II helicase)
MKPVSAPESNPTSLALQQVMESALFKKKLSCGNFDHVCLAAQSFVAACIIQAVSSRSFWLICSDVKQQEELFNGLLNWGVSALFFPEMELPLVETVVPDPDVVAERLDVLRRVNETQRSIVVLTERSLADPVPAQRDLRSQMQVIRRGDHLDRDQLADKLLNAGFEAVHQVSARGEFAVRGGILDLFSIQHALPVRIEFFGDEVDSIREFNPDEQTSIQILDQCEVLIADDQTNHVSLHRYIQKKDLLIRIETEKSKPDQSEQEIVGCKQISILSGALEPGGAEDFNGAFYESGFQDFEAGDFFVEETKRDQALAQLRAWMQEGWTILAICHNEGEAERLTDLLEDNGVESIQIAIGNLNHGFVYPNGQLAVLSDAEIFGRYQSPSTRRLALRRAKLRGNRAPINFSDLAEGDWVVHLEYGIGKYIGIRKLEQSSSGVEQEVVTLEFAEGARLYVPFEQAYLISRYVGIGKRYPTLSSLGDGKWSKTKKAAENAALDYAAKLLSIQAERNTLSGHAFPSDTKWQIEFETSFLYQETPDQLRAIQQTKADMESLQPMDRLICGDVGFGKTEVAIRAAFKAVMGGKQVAMLVPTTVLAQQHYHTLQQRMSDYPIKVAMLSRFLSASEQKKTLKGLADGSVDIVVGTHRLISGDIAFKDLGLAVIDEEQRFGVHHKERFKERFKLIDVLTLSATPIPRTLYLSLVGAKDMSVIETPPANRLSVETMICGYDERIIRDAIHRELRRKGQVYFLHNRVHSIERVRERILALCPKARVAIGHGQMDESELEEVMDRFVQGEVDVLISTTIIESGLDIPNANTMIIDRADRFGLADLYQLRGRVGRSQYKAYAYLLLPRDMLTVGAARKRINAIKQHSGLGAGFKIAMRDLEIRGAGNILGTAQSGHIINVGFELYCQLLQKAVEKIKGKSLKAKPISVAGESTSDQEEPTPVRDEAFVRLDFLSTNEAEYISRNDRQIPAYIPADYVSVPAARIEAYKKLAMLSTVDGLAELGDEWKDRYGRHPVAIKHLLLLAEVKLAAERSQISRVEVKDSKVMLTRGGEYLLIGDRFPRLTSIEPENNLGELLLMLNRFYPSK